MPSPFPLFRLPLVAFAVVISALHLENLIILTCCSRKSRKLAKTVYRSKKKVEILANFSDTNRILIGNEPFYEDFCVAIKKIPENLNYERVRVGDDVVPLTNESIAKYKVGGWVFHFEDVDNGLRTMFGWFIQFFDRSYGPELGINSEIYKDQVRSEMDWMLSITPKIERCFFKLQEISDDEYRKVLDVCCSVNRLCFHTKPSAGFPGHQFSFEGDHISIHGAFWLTLDNLMSVNARISRFADTRLTNVEMNRFLKHWMSGGCSKMVGISVDMEVINNEVLLADLNAVAFPENTERKFVPYKREAIISTGFDIKRNDGTLATIDHKPFPNKRFQLVVWSGL